MALTEKEVLTGLLSTAYQMDENGVASLYNEDGTIKDDTLESLKKIDAERVQKLKPDTKKFFDDGYKKAQSETLTKFERDLQEKFALKSDKKGVELINEILTEQLKAKGDLSEDAVKKHPAYISAIDKLQKEKDEAIKAESEKFTQFQAELNKKEVFNTVAGKAMDIFNGLKPVLSSDPSKAKNQLTDFVEKLKSYEYDIQGESIVVLKDGKVLEDKHGHRIQFENIVRETAEKYYDFHASDPKKSPSNGTEKPNGQKTSALEAPKTQNDFTRTLADSSIPVEDRLVFKEKYSKTFN